MAAATVAFLIGAAAGSFVNVCVFRLPRGLSLLWPRSRCPACERQIKWYDLVPLLSFFLLRRRCRACGAPIPWRYPLVETAAGVLCAAFFLRFGLSVELAAALSLAGALLAAALIDAEHLIVPDRISLFLAVAGLGFAGARGFEGVAAALWGAGMGGGILYLMGAAGRFFLRAESMGWGDIKLGSGIGLFLGPENTLWGLFYAVAAGALVGIGLRAAGRLGARQAMPFAPFLAAGATAALLWGGLSLV